MKKCLLALLIVLLASNVWAVPTIYRHIEPETVSFFTNAATTATSTQFQVNENIKKVKYGGSVTLTGFTCGLSGVTGAYFVSNPSVDLTQYIGLKVNLNTGGKNLTFWPFNTGTGETLSGVELIANGGFADTTGWTPNANCTIASILGGEAGNCLEMTAILSGQKYFTQGSLSLSQYALYQFSGYLKNGTQSGKKVDVSVYKNPNEHYFLQDKLTTASWVQNSGYVTVMNATGNHTMYVYWDEITNTGTILLDSFSLKNVLTPSATGVTITSTIGGPTGGWTMDSGFNLNATSFTVTVSLQ